jgi:hypothetical protein
MVSVDLKTIWVLAILLLVIILLSSITNCSKNKENFNVSNVSPDLKGLEEIIKKKRDNTLNQHVYLMRQANEINNLEENIKNIENLLSKVV